MNSSQIELSYKALISKRETARRLNYHPVSLMRLIRQGRLPLKPVRLSSNKTAFVESEVEDLVNQFIDNRDQGPEAA